MRAAFTGLFVGAFALVLPAIEAQAQTRGADVGRTEFETYCAVCHGKDGKGGGPFSMLVTKKVPDLTLMQKNNSGVFPFAQTYDIISGDADMPGHGTREMPIWGDVYRDRAIAELGPYNPNIPSYVRGRIIALIGHISTLQQK
ncbi:MAG: c-type cytochrome [Beijerinckiaceae bacterium]